MTVSSVTIKTPFNGMETSGLRPHVTVTWSGGVGPFDVLYEWDDNAGFTSPITDANNGVTSPDEGVPPSDMGGFGTDWFCRVTVTDDDDDVNEIQSIFNDASGGDFTLSFDGQGPTSTILWNDSAANVESALEGLSNITNVTVTGAGTSGDPWLVTFVDPGFQDVAMMTANDAGLTGQTVGTTIAEDTAGASASGVSSAVHTLVFVDPADHPRYLYVNHNIGLNFIAGVDGEPDDAARYLYLNHNIGVGFGPGLPDGEGKDFSRFLYVNQNITDDVPVPWIRVIVPTILETGDSLVIYGHGFDNVARDWLCIARLYDTPELDGSFVGLAETGFVAGTEPDEDVFTVTVPGGATTGWVVVMNDSGA